MKKQFMARLLSALLCTTMLACGSGAASADAADDLRGETEAVTNLPKVDQTAWQYSADDDVYYQIGISYCETPADTAYETLAIFVPGAYMTATENGDGTYT